MDKMSSSRVYPVDSIENKKSGFKYRIKNVGKWIAVMCGVPLTYLVLPISCCVRNPAAMVINDERPTNAGDMMGENLAVGMMGTMACVSCGCCCFGYFGSKAPDSF